MRWISLRSFVIGNFLSVALSFISFLVLSLVGIAVRPAGISIQDAVDQMPSVGWYNLLLPILGGLSLMVSGYIAAKLARRHLLLNGFLATTLLTAFNIYVGLMHDHTDFRDTAIVLVCWSSPFSALAGAYLRLLEAKKLKAKVV